MVELEDWEERHHLAPDDRSHGAIWTQVSSFFPPCRLSSLDPTSITQYLWPF